MICKIGKKKEEARELGLKIKGEGKAENVMSYECKDCVIVSVSENKIEYGATIAANKE